MGLKRISDKIKWTGEKLLSLLYPDICPFCGRILKKTELGKVCRKCELKLPYIYEPRCKKCGKPVGKENQEYCWDCEHRCHYFDAGLAVWEHRPMVAQAIYQFKYHNKRIYSRFFAREMVKSYESVIHKWNIDLIVPIPISKKRKRQRGYNQAELLALEIGDLLGISVDSHSLIRSKDTIAQKKLDVWERRLNLFKAFIWKGENISRSNILVIDDIYTTGNTIDAAARTLKASGASRVYFLTISIGGGF